MEPEQLRAGGSGGIMRGPYYSDEQRTQMRYRLSVRREERELLKQTTCPLCKHPDHPMFCHVTGCGCDLMTDPYD